MSLESIKALEHIVELCEQSENLSYRQIKIFDVALEGLGMVRRQRAEIIEKWREPHIRQIQERIQRRRDRQEAA